jgi:hypothetical protein
MGLEADPFCDFIEEFDWFFGMSTTGLTRKCLGLARMHSSKTRSSYQLKSLGFYIVQGN